MLVRGNCAGSKTRLHTGTGLDVYGCRGVCFCFFMVVFVFIVGEFFFVPGVVAQGGVGDAARVDYYLLGAWFEGGAA